MVLKLTGVDYILRLDAVDLRYTGGRKALIDENVTKLGRLAFFDDDLMIFHTLVGVPEFRLWDIRNLTPCTVCKRSSFSNSFSNADLNRLGIDASRLTPCTVCKGNPLATPLATPTITCGHA